ncbi:MAG: hypothetical protein VYD39_01355, partial [Bacteroidota bacterium]|nr:hypothetical protein [Bacteroidota bacterium]
LSYPIGAPNMADRTPQHIRGFIVPSKIEPQNIWTAQSSFSQQNPTAGEPTPNQISPMTLLSTGNQTSAGNTTIITRAAGAAGYGAAYTFTDNTYSETIEFGRDAYNAISGFEYIHQSGSAPINQYYFPTCTTDSADSLHIAYHKFNGTASVNKVALTTTTKTGTSSEQIIYSELAFVTTTQKFHPVLVRLDDDSLMLFHLLEDDGKANIRAHRSEDNGATWSCVSRETLKDAINVGTATGSGVDTHNIQRIRAAQHNDVILLLIETNYNDTAATKRNRLFQFVSIDKGGTFQLVTSATNLAANSFHSISLAVRNGRFCVVYCGTLTRVHYIELPNAFSSIHLLRDGNQFAEIKSGTADAVATGTADFMENGNTALLTEENGNLYCMYYNQTLNKIIQQFSTFGVRWELPNGATSTTDLANVFNTDDAGTTLANMFAIKWIGRGIIACNLETALTIHNSICVVFLGGNANVNLPKSSYAKRESDVNRASYMVNYLPIDLPSNISGLNVVGTGSDAISSGFLRIESSPSHASKRDYEFADLTQSIVVSDNNLYVTAGLIVRASFKVVQGGSVTLGGNNTGIKLQTDNGTSANYAITLIGSTTQFRLLDDTSGTIGTVSFDMTQGIDIMIAISDNTVATFYRAMNNDELRKWTAGPTSTSLTNGGGSSAGQKVFFGHLNYSSGTMQTDFKEMHVSSISATGMQISGGFDNPNDLNARPYPKKGQYNYVYDSVSISTTDGPTYEGDKWNIEPRFDFPIENTLHNVVPTPRIQWRSTAVSSGSVAAQSIAVKFDSDLTNTNSGFMANDLMAIHLNNINWISGNIYYYDSGAWSSLGSIANQIRSFCTVAGRTARGTAGLAEPYFTLNELKDWTCYFLDSGTRHYKKIISNTEGKFGGTATTTKQCTITVDTAPPQTANVVYFIPPIISIVMNMNGKKAQGFKIEITSQQTYNNDIRIGTMLIGPCIIPGKQYQTREITTEQGTTTQSTQDGIRYTRELKPPERIINLSWSEGIDISSLQGDEPNIDYWVSSNQTGAEPIAVQDEAPDLLSNFVRTLTGSKDPIVYLPVITKSTSSGEDFRVLQREKEQLLCTLDSDITISHVLGDELQSEGGEVFRVATMTFREIT